MSIRSPILILNQIYFLYILLGKSNWEGSPNADAVIDELKIYYGGMSENDVLNDFLDSSLNGI